MPPKPLLDVLDAAGWERSYLEDGPGWLWLRLSRGWLTSARVMEAKLPHEWRIEFGWLPFLPADCFACRDLGEVARVLQQRNLILED